jgi:hypothetical protein
MHNFFAEAQMMALNYDDLREHAEANMPKWFADNRMALHVQGHENVDLVVTGWSESEDRPTAFFFSSETSSDRIFDVDEYIVSPEVSDEEDENLHQLGCELFNDIDIADFDPVDHGIPLMEAQRRTPIKHHLGGELFIVGGHVMVSEVTRDGISQKIIHQWPDEIGKPICPEPFRAASNRVPNTWQNAATHAAQRRH